MAKLTSKQRKDVPAEDFAGPNRTFPITDQSHLEAAASMLHHAADPEAVKAKAIRIAKRKGLKIPDSWKSDSDSGDGKTISFEQGDGLLVNYGSGLKTIEGRESGWLGGYLVQFTGPEQPDTSKFKDFFTAKTDYDIELPATISVFYHHGLDPVIGQKRLTQGEVGMVEDGIEIEAKLDMEVAIQRQIWEKAGSGDLGWSSGAIPWLVGRKAVGGTHEVVQWPLKEASITPTPAFPNAVVALKSLVEEPGIVDLMLLGGSKLHDLGDVALDALDAYIDRVSSIKSYRDGKLTPAHHDRLYRIKNAIETVMAETEPVHGFITNDHVDSAIAEMHINASRALGLNI